MANEGFVYVKGKGELDVSRFFTPVDKGAAKPAFCYPAKMKDFKESVDSMQRALERGQVNKEHELSYRVKFEKHRERLEQLRESTETAKNVIAEDPDGWNKRREELKKKITAAMPSRKDIKERRVNPHSVARMEKSGLGKLKTEYQIISRAMGEDSNISFLEREK
jgi:hypothetical protein